MHFSSWMLAKLPDSEFSQFFQDTSVNGVPTEASGHAAPMCKSKPATAVSLVAREDQAH